MVGMRSPDKKPVTENRGSCNGGLGSAQYKTELLSTIGEYNTGLSRDAEYQQQLQNIQQGNKATTFKSSCSISFRHTENKELTAQGAVQDSEGNCNTSIGAHFRAVNQFHLFLTGRASQSHPLT